MTYQIIEYDDGHRIYIKYKSTFYLKIYREMEQLVARRAHNPKVVGSSPALATKEKVSYLETFSCF